MIRSLKGLYHLFVAAFSVLWFRFPGKKLTVVGVTGTDGKTTTTTLIYDILKSAGFGVSMISSVHAVIAGTSYDTGFHVTTPNAFWVQKYLREAVDHCDRYIVLEVTSHALTQYRVFGVPFAVGVITNVSHEHLDWHRTFDELLRAKFTLLKHARIAVVNRDDQTVYAKALTSFKNKTMITYGIHKSAMVTPKTVTCTTKLPGEFNQYNCLAALAAARALGISERVAQRAIARFSGIPGRMEVIKTTPFRVIVDFAHTPNALVQALKTARSQTKGRLIHVFGSAGLRDHSKRPLMGKASGAYADIIVLTEEDYRTENVEEIMDQIASGIDSKASVNRFPHRFDAIAFAISQARAGDLVIITGKGHERSLCRGTVEFPWSDQEAAIICINQNSFQ